LLSGLPSFAARVLGRRYGQSPAGRICTFLERRQQGGSLAADLGRKPTRSPRGLEKLASAPLLTGARRLVGRRLVASGLALKLSGPPLAAV
jgi:hypothetical protein